ncbi:MAG TPA: acyl-CoA dehydrogenase [Thermoanaerobaculia bacterium]|nr:acyl-CoA dehydrogenase [Thermoanaerobaculia bacterium]
MTASEARRAALAEPHLAAYLPLVYVAWADGDLEPAEIADVRARVEAGDDLLSPIRALLCAWLDPAAAPSAAELADLLTSLQRASQELPDGERRSLAALGAELAGRRGTTIPPAEREALDLLEAALGVDGTQAARKLTGAVRKPPETAPAAAPFDVAGLTGFLDGEQRGVRERVRRLLSAPEFAYRSELGREAYRAQVLAWCRRLAAEGIGPLGLPREHGGGGDPAAFLAAFETLAHHDLSLLVKFGVQFGLFAGGIHQLGTTRHHAAYLPAAARLDLPGGFAMTETGHGSNVADLETTARYDPGGGVFEIHTPHAAARKDYIGGAARDARLAVVFAQLETGGARHGVHAFVVPLRDAGGKVLPGIYIEDCGEKLGLNGVDNGRIGFDHVRVPREALLDRFATVAADGSYSSPIASPGKRFFTMLGTLVGGRVSVALASLSAAKSALCTAVRYAERRRQFGAPGEPETLLLDYPAHQRRLLPRLAATYAFHFALRDLADRYVGVVSGQAGDEERRTIEGLAAGLKALASWHAVDTIQACREACGGQGYLAVNRFGALRSDSDVFTTFEGDNTVLLQLVAKGLLSAYRKQFGDMDFVDLVRFVAARAGTAVRELNPIVTRSTDPGHLRDPEFHLAALRWREEHLIETVSRRLRKRLGAGLEPNQAMLECQTHLLAAARAHVERTLVERAAAAVAAAPAEHAAVLRPVLALDALARLEAGAGWLLEHGVFEVAKARAVRKQVDVLCLELRPMARSLVDAFAIPDEILAAPIAL